MYNSSHYCVYRFRLKLVVRVCGERHGKLGVARLGIRSQFICPNSSQVSKDAEEAFKKTVEVDRLIDLLRDASPNEIHQLVAENVLAFNEGFWVRLAARSDTCKSEDDKKDYEELAATVMTIVDLIVHKTNEKIDSATDILKSILKPVVDQDDEICWPPRDPQALMQMEKSSDKGLLSLAPPHQGIDGEWTDGFGVIVYKWNGKRTWSVQKILFCLVVLSALCLPICTENTWTCHDNSNISSFVNSIVAELSFHNNAVRPESLVAANWRIYTKEHFRCIVFILQNRVVDQEKRGDANGIAMIVMTVSKTIAPACGGALSHTRHFESKTQRHRELFSLMHHVVRGEDPEVKKGKPSPDIFLAVAKRFQSGPVDPQFAPVFEDAPSEVGAEKIFGMFVVVVPDPRLDSSYVGTAYQVLTSLLEFDPTEWGLPPFEDLEA